MQFARFALESEIAQEIVHYLRAGIVYELAKTWFNAAAATAPGKARLVDIQSCFCDAQSLAI